MSLRSQISEIINNITPLDDMEKVQKTFVQEWIASGADIFRIHKPATPDAHLVSYFVPYDIREKKICLGHHTKANLWLPPGGHVDVDEHPRDAAAREMEEELFEKAIFLKDNPLFLTVANTVNENHSHTDVSLWYVVKGCSNKMYKFDAREYFDVAWFSFEDIPQKMVEPHLSRFLLKLKQLN